MESKLSQLAKYFGDISPGETDNTYSMSDLEGTICGKVININAARQFGFIKPDKKLPDGFKTKTIFFHFSVVEGQQLVFPTSPVCLKLNLKARDKPKAVWVRVIPKLSDVNLPKPTKPAKVYEPTYSLRALEGLLHGSVTCVKNGFGFVKPDSALPHPYNRRDVYFSEDCVTSMDDVRAGQRAVFQLKTDQKDKPAVAEIAFLDEDDELGILDPYIREACGHICFTYGGMGEDVCVKKCPQSLSCGHSCPRVCSDPCPELCDDCVMIKMEATKLLPGYNPIKSILLGSITFVGEEHGYIKPYLPLPKQTDKKNGVFFSFDAGLTETFHRGLRVAFTLKQGATEKPRAEQLAIVKEILEDDVDLQLIPQVYRPKRARQQQTQESNIRVEINQRPVVTPRPLVSSPVDKLEVEAAKGSSNTLLKHHLSARRQFDSANPLDLNFRIAESQFLRLAQKAGKQYEIESVDYYINPDLVRRFRAKCSEFESTIGRGNSMHVLAFHGTQKRSIDSIVRDNFKLEYCQRSLYGQGIYLSEFPHVSMDFGRSLLLCKVLPGRSRDVNDSMTGASIAYGFNSHRVKADTDGYGWALVVENPDQILPCYVINYKDGGTSSQSGASSRASSYHAPPSHQQYVYVPSPPPQRRSPPRTYPAGNTSNSKCLIQ